MVLFLLPSGSPTSSRVTRAPQPINNGGGRARGKNCKIKGAGTQSTSALYIIILEKKWVLLIQFYRCGNWGIQKLYKSLKVTQNVCVRAGYWTRSLDSLIPYLVTCVCKGLPVFQITIHQMQAPIHSLHSVPVPVVFLFCLCFVFLFWTLGIHKGENMHFARKNTDLRKVQESEFLNWWAIWDWLIQYTWTWLYFCPCSTAEKSQQHNHFECLLFPYPLFPCPCLYSQPSKMLHYGRAPEIWHLFWQVINDKVFSQIYVGL